MNISKAFTYKKIEKKSNVNVYDSQPTTPFKYHKNSPFFCLECTILIIIAAEMPAKCIL